MSTTTLCQVCQAATATQRCERCGTLACDAHYHEDTGFCANCTESAGNDPGPT